MRSRPFKPINSRRATKVYVTFTHLVLPQISFEFISDETNFSTDVQARMLMASIARQPQEWKLRHLAAGDVVVQGSGYV